MPNGGQTKLEMLAIEARKKLIPKNIYNRYFGRKSI
jgi:hypothetical protein